MCILTHWARVTHTCISKWTIIGPDNSLSPDRCQAIIWTNAGILLTGPLGTNFSDISIKIHKLSFKKMHLEMSVKWRPFCLGLNVLSDLVLKQEYSGMIRSIYHFCWCPGSLCPWVISSNRLCGNYGFKFDVNTLNSCFWLMLLSRNNFAMTNQGLKLKA